MCAHSNNLGNKQLAIKKKIPASGSFVSSPSAFSATSVPFSLSALGIATVVSAKPLEFLTGEGSGNATLSGCKLWATFVSSKPHQCGVRYNPVAMSHRSNELVGRKKKKESGNNNATYEYSQEQKHKRSEKHGKRKCKRARLPTPIQSTWTNSQISRKPISPSYNLARRRSDGHSFVVLMIHQQPTRCEQRAIGLVSDGNKKQKSQKAFAWLNRQATNGTFDWTLKRAIARIAWTNGCVNPLIIL